MSSSNILRMIVREVIPGSSSFAAGLRRFDCVVQINEKKVSNLSFAEAVKAVQMSGSSITLTIKRTVLARAPELALDGLHDEDLIGEEQLNSIYLDTSAEDNVEEIAVASSPDLTVETSFV